MKNKKQKKHRSILVTHLLTPIHQFTAVLLIALGVSAWPMTAMAACFGCPCNDSDSLMNDWLNSPFDLSDYGGVTLNKTLNLLNNIDQIEGAAYDPVKGEIVLAGQGTVSVEEKIDLDDLVVALRTIYSVDVKGNTIDPGITFYGMPDSLSTGKHGVLYIGATENTKFGQILYEADYILKMMGQGVYLDDADGQYKLLTERPVPADVAADYCNTDPSPTFSSCFGYQSSAEGLLKHPGGLQYDSDNDSIPDTDLRFGFWFSPQTVDLDAYSDTTTGDRSFKFQPVKMQVEAKIKQADGTDADPTTYDAAIYNIVWNFANNITDNYDAYERIPGFETLKKLKRLAKITAIVRWLRNNYIPVDLSFMEDYVPTPVNTPTNAQLLQLCLDGTGNIVPSESGLYDTAVGGPCAVKMVGGVSYYTENVENVAPLSNVINSALNSTERVTNPLVSNDTFDTNQLGWVDDTDMAWAFSADGQDYFAIAQTMAPSGKDGQFDFNSADLALPNQAGQSLSFNRYYQSFSNVPSGFGPGWSELPFNLRFPESSSYFEPIPSATCGNGTRDAGEICDDGNTVDGDGCAANCLSVGVCGDGNLDAGEICDDGNTVGGDGCLASCQGIIAPRMITVDDRVAGGSATFSLASTRIWILNQGTSEEEIHMLPYYVAEYAKTNDWVYKTPDGFYVYEQLDSTDDVIKRVFFWPRTNGNPAYFADPIYVAVGASDGSNDFSGGITTYFSGGVWTYYEYSAPGKLSGIWGHDGVTAGFNGLTDERKITLEYVGDRISRAFYNSSDGLRDVTYGYDNGRLETVTRSSGHVQKYTYEDLTDYTSGVIATVTDQTRGETQIEVDPDLEGRSTQTTPEGNAALASEVFYDRVNGLMRSSDSLGRITTVQRDGKGRLLDVSRQASVKGETQTLSTGLQYNDSNPLAGPTDITDVRNNTTIKTYDVEGNVKSIVEPITDVLSRTTSIERGIDTSDGFSVVVVADPKTRKSARKYDEFGRLVTVYRRVTVTQTPIPDTDQFNFTFDYLPGYAYSIAYDPVSGAVASVTNDAGELVTDYPWITGNEKVEFKDRNLNNNFGLAETVVSAAGYSTKYGYDGLARLRSVKSPADVSATTVGYYESGLEQDQVGSVTTTVGTTKQTYDVAQRNTTTVDSRGVTTNNYYNRKGQLERVVEVSPDAATVLTTSYFYDDFGKLDYKLLPNGSRVTYGYDGFDRIESITEREGNDASTSNTSPTLTATPPETSTVTSGGTFTFNVNASDADAGDTVSFYLVKAPEGMSIDSNGLINWTPTGGQEGTHQVAVQVVDGNGGVESVTFQIVVDDTISTTDNCTLVPNEDQLDSDGDGYGNACDPDLNNDGLVNFADLAEFKKVYGELVANPSANLPVTNADFNSDLKVDDADLEILNSYFGGPPGPSADPNRMVWP